MIHSIFDVG